MYYNSNKISYHPPYKFSFSTRQQALLSSAVLVIYIHFRLSTSLHRRQPFTDKRFCLFLLSLLFGFICLSWMLTSCRTHPYTFACQCSYTKFEASNPSNSYFAQYLSRVHVAAHPNDSKYFLFCFVFFSVLHVGQEWVCISLLTLFLSLALGLTLL